MKLKVIFQMEPLDIADKGFIRNTLLLMREAERRGYEVHQYVPRNLQFKNGKVRARASKITFTSKKSEGDYFKATPAKWVDLTTFDVVMIRQNPPFDMDYISATYLLELVMDKVLVVNNPASLRNFPEKICPALFPQYTPQTLITTDVNEMEAFAKEHKDVVVKPLYGYHGYGVYRFKAGDLNQEAFFEQHRMKNGQPMVVQPYIKEVEKGNVRVVFFDGEIGGSIITVPGKGEFRIFRHSKDLRYTLSAHDKKICKDVGAFLKREGIMFAGIDIIGRYLLEINITSVGSLHRINELYKRRSESDLWDVIAAKV